MIVFRVLLLFSLLLCSCNSYRCFEVERTFDGLPLHHTEAGHNSGLNGPVVRGLNGKTVSLRILDPDDKEPERQGRVAAEFVKVLSEFGWTVSYGQKQALLETADARMTLARDELEVLILKSVCD